MAFKRGGRPTYYIGPLTVAGIDVPRISTGVANGRTAKSMETALLELATSGYSDLVRQVAAGDLALAEVYEAKLSGEEALQRLQTRGSDHLLSDIIGEIGRSGLHAVLSDERTIAGLELLRTLTRRDARLSSLCDPKLITSLYERAIQGTDRNAPRRPNSVRRSLHRAVSEILTHEFGRGKMLAIMADVRVPWENDERIVFLSREEITRALEIADPEFRPVLGLAVTTGIDRGPCRTTRVRHYDRATGVLTIVDTKSTSRPRTLMLRGEPVLENAEHWLRLLVVDRAGHEPLVALTDRQIRTRWEAVRQGINRPELRWKDLRGIFATYYLQAGGDVRQLQYVLGHAGMAMTMRYLRRVPPGRHESLRIAAQSVGRLETKSDVYDEAGGNARVPRRVPSAKRPSGP